MNIMMHFTKEDSIDLQSDFNYVISYYYDNSEFYVKVDNPNFPTRNVKTIRAFFQSSLANMHDYQCYGFTLSNMFKVSSFKEQILFMTQKYKKFA